ncbi:MAG: hypothetical protein TREMPRED_003207 [Tremellales sp. Tagirdzhanova-0007]|nr:MAG: hypothetical protein TREMPRED_003207 [Tremellales sp. Tagirdzhanova-0007]
MSDSQSYLPLHYDSPGKEKNRRKKEDKLAGNIPWQKLVTVLSDLGLHRSELSSHPSIARGCFSAAEVTDASSRRSLREALAESVRVLFYESKQQDDEHPEKSKYTDYYWREMVMTEIKKMREACRDFGNTSEPAQLALGTAIDDILNDGDMTFRPPTQ